MQNSENILDLSDIKCGKGTCFVFTSWDVQPPVFNEKVMWYLAYAQESAETTGGRHWQGYVQMMCQQRNVAVKEELGLKKGYIAAQKASHAEVARAYVWKLDTKVVPPVEFGTFRVSEQGKRTDIEVFVDAAMDTSAVNTKRKMIQDHKSCMVKYMRAYEDIKATFTDPRTWKTKVVVIYGLAGSGKTTHINDMFPDAMVMSALERGWWDEYDRHEVVIMDDFRGSWMKIEEFLALADAIKCTVQAKGSRRKFVAKLIVITCSAPPPQWWGEEALNGRYQEVERRIDALYEFKNREKFLKVGWRQHPELYSANKLHTDYIDVL
jgi:hypothetical protein